MCLYIKDDTKTVKHTVKLPTSQGSEGFADTSERPGRKERKKCGFRRLARFRPQGLNLFGLWTFVVVQLTRSYYKRAIRREVRRPNPVSLSLDSQGPSRMFDLKIDISLEWM